MTVIEFNHRTIPILSAGKGWIVVDKPSGMSVHNDPGNDLTSAVNSFLKKKDGFHPLGCDPAYGMHAVHRLDRETSGVVILAGQPAAVQFLARQFEKRTVKKRYQAVVHGLLSEPDGEDGWGTWEWPLTRQAGGRHCPEGKGSKVDCRTRYRVLQHTAHYTLIECELLTGRKHQIRRHLKLAGHAIVGDRRYGTPRSVKFLKNQRGFDRLGLHAMAISLRVPGQDSIRTVESPGLPPEMQMLLNGDDKLR